MIFSSYFRYNPFIDTFSYEKSPRRIPFDKEIKNIKIIETKILKKINRFFTIVELFLILIIVLGYYFSFEVHTKRVIFIPKGSTNYIVSYLDKNNFDLNLLDKLALKVLGYPQSGWIDLKSTHMTKLDFLHKLTTSKAALKKVTLTPGETYYFFLQDLANTLHISQNKLFELYSELAYKKDGNIIADTYHLPIGMDEKQLLDHLFSITEKKYERLSQRIFGEYNKKNWYKYVTIASIIQKESANIQEMPLVASVVHNRLKKNMRLQMDGSLNYGKYSHTKVTPTMIKEDTTSYNTYKYRGVPQDPVCAIEFDAIRSAIFPAKTNYLYFVKNVNGDGHKFSTNYKQHVNNINKLKYKRKSTKTTKTPITVSKKKIIKQLPKKKQDRSDKLRKLWD